MRQVGQVVAGLEHGRVHQRGQIRVVARLDAIERRLDRLFLRCVLAIVSPSLLSPPSLHRSLRYVPRHSRTGRPASPCRPRSSCPPARSRSSRRWGRAAMPACPSRRCEPCWRRLCLCGAVRLCGGTASESCQGPLPRTSIADTLQLAM